MFPLRFGYYLLDIILLVAATWAFLDSLRGLLGRGSVVGMPTLTGLIALLLFPALFWHAFRTWTASARPT